MVEQTKQLNKSERSPLNIIDMGFIENLRKEALDFESSMNGDTHQYVINLMALVKEATKVIHNGYISEEYLHEKSTKLAKIYLRSFQ